MDKLFAYALEALDTSFDRLAGCLPVPEPIRWKDSFVYRYKDPTVHHAIVLKMARMISGLRAAYVLLSHGYVQEQGAVQRMLDEIGDDIMFLVYGVTNDTITELHTEFLEYFFQEEFEEQLTPIESPQKRGMVPRKKIRAYLSGVGLMSADGQVKFNRSDNVDLMRTMSKAYSGYVHAAAPHIMEMYGGDPPRFHLDGMRGTPRIPAHAEDLWNYYYRGLMNAVCAAKAFGDKELVDFLSQRVGEFEQASGDRVRR